ncbi:GTPase-activating protein BEM3 [Spathaspora sp. JA1]|nr:GTPase-activating protein BEM3 [Spathaspora sp. JA1]
MSSIQEEYTPSDPEFDRSHLSDSQYIEQLIFENKELKALLAKQNNLIFKLNQELKNNPSANGSAVGTGTPGSPTIAAPGSPTATLGKIMPLRPHKLLPAVVTNATTKLHKTLSSTSPISLKSPGSIASNRYEDLHTSPTRRKSPIQPPFSHEHLPGTSSSPNQIPMRSSRRRDNSSLTLDSKNSNSNGEDHINFELNKEEASSNANILDAYISGKSSSNSILSPYENASDTEDKESEQEEVAHEEEEMLSDGNIGQHTIISTTSASNTIVESTPISTVTKIYSQDREGLTRSSSSIGSTYKSSRIKLPGGNTEKPPLDTLKSPTMFMNPPRYETPPNQSAPNFAPTNTTTISASPEAFKDDTLGMNVTNIPNSLVEAEGRNSHISSPIQGTLTHAHSSLAPPYEPDTYTTPTITSHSVYDPCQTPGSSFNVVVQSPNLDESSLFIKPEEFNTIYILVVSTITINSAHQTSKKSDDPNITMTINDRETNKEMWRIRKNYSQLMLFDQEIRPIIEYFGLPLLPDKPQFLSTTPTKIEMRRSIIENYFKTIFLMPHIPHMVIYKICKFLSLDFVNPLDDFKSGARKEGFLIRRYKGLGSNWKIRWCQVDGPFLEIYENPGGAILEQIKLSGSQIGRQSSDSIAEDKGYRHAFVIMEPHKSSKLQSSLPKHFFCAETDQERDEWVEALIEFTQEEEEMVQEDIGSPMTSFMETPSSRYDSGNDELESRRYLGSSHQQQSTSSFDQISTNTSFSNEEIVTTSGKKSKKKSLFAFGRNNNKISETSIDEIETIISDPPTTLSDVPMQHYLNQLSLDEHVSKSIFGRNIEVAFDLSNHEFMNKQIPSICYRCLDYLNKTGAIFEEGIFRLSGSASTIRQLKDLFNTQYDLDLLKCHLKPDIHTVAGLFKSYLRELPNPILGLTAYNHLNQVMLHSQTSPWEIAMIFRDYFNNSANVDRVHYDLSFVIFKFLRTVISQQSINRMNLRNVCIVFVPTLNISIEVLQVFLVDFECIFENGKPVSDANREVLDLRIPNF